MPHVPVLVRVAFLMGMLVLPAMSRGASAPVVLVPTPKQVEWSGEQLTLPRGQVTIVIGERATPPEVSAADLLRRRVLRRFGQDWHIVREAQAADTGVLVLLGQRTAHRMLDRLCTGLGIDLSAASPGGDGYVIVPTKEARHDVIIVGGSDGRGVIYGQDTLFQMLAQSHGDLVLHPATVRDAPSIPWRGRPQTNINHYLKPGEMDLYMTARINFIDLRNGIYAYEPGDAFDENEVRRVITDAHRCGIIVYATINCGVPKAEYDKILEMYKRFLDLGADGLWLSFDDKGPGEAPEELVRRVLEFGRTRNISGHLIATTPPKGAYQKILFDFNRRIMAIPGMETALWFWTSLPLPEALADARSIGLKVRPSWWHNWTRPDPGFTHAGSGSYVDGAPYLDLPPLAVGWHYPSYERLAPAAESAEAIMPWGGNGWGQYYVVPVIGWWGWRPEAHDFEAVRSRIYDTVYGREQVEAARAFDDGLREAKSLFTFVINASDAEPPCPGRLRDPGQRQKALDLLQRMRAAYETIVKGAPGGTMLEPDALKAQYLDAMEAELRTAEIEAKLDFPEFWWQEHQRELLSAIYSDDMKKAEELIVKARPRVRREVEAAAKALAHLKPTEAYLKWWQTRASMSAADWKKLLADRRTEVPARVADYNRRAVPTETMLKDLTDPPLEWGTGRWERSNRVLATVTPSGREMFWGEWISGTYKHGDSEVAVFAFNPKTHGSKGGFAELGFSVPISGDRRRLALLLFMSNANKENIGGDFARHRMAGYREITLSWQDRTLWREDFGIQREAGQWFMIRLPELPPDLAELPLRLRVEDVKESHNNFGIVYVGPVRLMELGGIETE